MHLIRSLNSQTFCLKSEKSWIGFWYEHNETNWTQWTGRKERYKFFDQVAQEINANKIAIAHNLNDNAETVLMHLLRGSGITGLCGIKPDREGRYIRPIIKCERAEIVSLG